MMEISKPTFVHTLHFVSTPRSEGIPRLLGPAQLLLTHRQAQPSSTAEELSPPRPSGGRLLLAHAQQPPPHRRRPEVPDGRLLQPDDGSAIVQRRAVRRGALRGSPPDDGAPVRAAAHDARHAANGQRGRSRPATAGLLPIPNAQTRAVTEINEKSTRITSRKP